MANISSNSVDPRHWPRQFWIGLGLIVIFWPLNWLLNGLRTHLLFFPLWLGFILTVDGIVYRRRGTSLLSRNWRAFVAMFLISAPVWWLFEVINWHTQNWQYLGRERFEPLTYFVLASIAFSTVMPAVFEASELVSTFGWTRHFEVGPRLRPTATVIRASVIAGFVTLALLLAFPKIFFPLTWVWLYLLLVPLNHRLGRRTLLSDTAAGNWRPVVSLVVGVLICGFFWEFWNFYAYPKWVYHVAPFEFWHVFEMPLLGYGGYIPFSLELFASFHLVSGFFAGSTQQVLDLGGGLRRRVQLRG
ncbi:MAG: hypothetical protein R3300_06545 [Candidatus Promineifilaceae bacterium]|nr:hypothetical protein [Candidatus Promineifilaceae bacterium]